MYYSERSWVLQLRLDIAKNKIKKKKQIYAENYFQNKLNLNCNSSNYLDFFNKSFFFFSLGQMLNHL